MSRRSCRLRALLSGGTLAAVTTLAACPGVGHVVELPHGTPPPQEPGLTFPHGTHGAYDYYYVISSVNWRIVAFLLGLGSGFDSPAAGSASPFSVLAPEAVLPTAAQTARGRGVSARASGDSIVIGATISGPPKGTTFQFLTYGTLDTAGNLWLSAGNSSLQGSVIEYTAAQLKTGGAIAPAVAIGGLQIPEGVAIDKSGDLWVLDYQTDELLEFTPAQLKASGSPAPATRVSLADMTFAGATYFPRELAFDKSGNAWISFIISFATRPPVSVDSIPNEIVAQYAATTITTSGTPTPSIVLRPTGADTNVFAVGYGVGLAIDSAGNLWTANTALANVSEFTAASLVPGANPSPAVTLTGNWASNGGLVGISFGADGALLVATGQELLVYRPSQITQSGSPTPDITYPNSSANPVGGVIGNF